MDSKNEQNIIPQNCPNCSKTSGCTGKCGKSSEDNSSDDNCPIDGACSNGGLCSNGGGCCAVRGKLSCHNWLDDVPGGLNQFDMIEVQFKNTRKGYYKNNTNIPLAIGDMVAVEASPGHDIGQVTLTGKLVALQMKKSNLRADAEILRVFRIAKASDLERFEAAKARENDTMIRSRKIAEDLRLNMKIGDVEYQGDGNKAIFYYIADDRVDFRQLIKILADTFKIRVEMKQIGARQEAGRIGGIGPCGRPLCCSSWMTNFVSVSTSAARYQDISLNPQKLAGQCAKLKCCLNFEVDTYAEAVKKMPPKDTWLDTKDSTYYHFKSDIFKREITYSTDRQMAVNLVTISADRAFEIIMMNRKGNRPDTLSIEENQKKAAPKEFGDIIGQDSVTRFDKNKRKKNNRNRNNSNSQERNNEENKGNDNQQNGNQPRDNRPPRPPRDKNRNNNPQRNDAAPRDNNAPRQQGEQRQRQNNDRRRPNRGNGNRPERNNRNEANGNTNNKSDNQ